jgi:hypothetical protein
MKRSVTLCLFLVCVCALSAQRRFDDLFPALPAEIKNAAFTPEGFTSCVTDPARLAIASDVSAAMFSGTFADRIASGGFSYISENLLVIPHPENRAVTLPDIYNSLQHVRAMTTVKYHSFTRKKWVPLFESAYRIESPEKQAALPDLSSSTIPQNETLYIKVKDINLGSTIYRSDLAVIGPAAGPALLYTITNHKASALFLVTVINPEGFVSRIYLEPLAEGTLVYCVACIRVPAFVDRMIDMPSALKKRLDVLTEWALAGLNARGSLSANYANFRE